MTLVHGVQEGFVRPQRVVYCFRLAQLGVGIHQTIVNAHVLGVAKRMGIHAYIIA